MVRISFYIILKGILYLPVFCGAVASLYRNYRQILISLPIGIFLAFPANPIWPYKYTCCVKCA